MKLYIYKRGIYMKLNKNKKSATSIILIVYSLIVTSLISLVLVFATAEGNNYNIEFRENSLMFITPARISSYSIKDIQSLRLLQEFTLKKSDEKNTGISNGNFYVGKAEFEKIGSCNAYVYQREDCFILMEYRTNTHRNGHVLFNLETEKETEELYFKIKGWLDNYGT